MTHCNYQRWASPRKNITDGTWKAREEVVHDMNDNEYRKKGNKDIEKHFRKLEMKKDSINSVSRSF